MTSGPVPRSFRGNWWLPALMASTPVAVPSGALAAPLASVAAPSYHFGTIREGERVKHTFQISNQGNEPLIISRVLPGCGCIAVAVKTGPILPGESTPIDISFASDGFSGSVASNIRIIVNDPEKAYADLTLRGEVRPYFSAVPSRVLFADVVQLRGSEVQEVVLRKTPGRSLTARSLSRVVTVDVRSDTKDELRLGVRIAPNAPVGELRERILIRESGRGGKSFSIPVFAVVKPVLEVSRSTVVLNPEGVSAGSQGSVILNNWAERPFGRPRFVFSQQGRVLVQTKELDPGRTWELSFSLDPQKAAGSVDERVTILGDDDSGPSVSLRVVTSNLSVQQ